MSCEKILIVEDEPVIRTLLCRIVERHKLQVSCAGTLAEAKQALGSEQFDIIMLDLRLPDGDGLSLIEHVSSLAERPIVVMMTGFGTVETAVAAMRAGAFDYVLKPLSASQVDVIINKARTHRQLLSVNKLLSDDMEDGESVLVGRSPAMMRLRQLIERVAPTDATVLVTGESGTGKEMVSREFYRRSPRNGQPFIKVNCAAVSENLIESEFFGHERGAFTGATNRREGRFELAHNGTLLLDEISEIPASLQAKLLRVLQEREFERVGGSRTIKVNVRLIATSNRDLASNVERGDFRQDLYYRLNVFPVHVPPLRERVEDIPLLAEYFLARCVRKHGVKVTGFTDTACRLMLSYRWPGNVRELQNTIERAVILSESGRPVSSGALGLPADVKPTEISSGHPWAKAAPERAPINIPLIVPPSGLSTSPAAAVAAALASNRTSAPPTVVAVTAPPARVEAAPPAERPIVPLDQLEKEAICAALRQTTGNRTQAAAALGISIRTLRNKLQEYREAGEDVDCDVEAVEA